MSWLVVEVGSLRLGNQRGLAPHIEKMDPQLRVADAMVHWVGTVVDACNVLVRVPLDTAPPSIHPFIRHKQTRHFPITTTTNNNNNAA